MKSNNKYETLFRKASKTPKNFRINELIEFAQGLSFSKMKEEENIKLRRYLIAATKYDNKQICKVKEEISKLKQSKEKRETIKSKKEDLKRYKSRKRTLKRLCRKSRCAEAGAGLKQALWTIFGFAPRKIYEFKKKRINISLDKNTEKMAVTQIRTDYAAKRVKEIENSSSQKNARDYRRLAKLKTKEERLENKQRKLNEVRTRKLKLQRNVAHKAAVIERSSNGLTILGAAKHADQKTKVKTLKK